MSSTINTGAPTQIFGEPSSRARHARESAARAAAVRGVSREGIRQAKALRQLAEQTDAPELAALADRLFGEVVRGERSLNSVYRSLITNNGQRRLLLTLPDWLDDRLRVAAAETGVSRQRLIVDLLTGWLAE